MKPLLQRGDKVRLLSAPQREAEIEVAGAAGFKVKDRMAMFPWPERGQTWSSDQLDRIDAAKTQFNQTARG